MRGLSAPGTSDTVGIVRVMDRPITSAPPEVAGVLHVNSAGSHVAAAAALNTFDVAIVQHDFSIYGGADGDQVLAVLDQVRVPVVTVTHAVPETPTPHQAAVLRQVTEASDAVVAMTDAARERLVRRYGAEPAKVTVIGHGASTRLTADGAPSGKRPVILTWGLLGPGKGIEWAIDGLRRLRHLDPAPLYVVAGQTHPRVRLHEGESYRIALVRRAQARGVTPLVRFIGSYLDEAALTRLINRADLVLLPYDSREQVTSGVLVEAVAAGKPVVATAFPHAVELLDSGAGLVVPQYDSAAIGEALFRVLSEPALARRMAAEAERLAPSVHWPAIAAQYRALTTELLAARSSMSL